MDRMKRVKLLEFIDKPNNEIEESIEDAIDQKEVEMIGMSETYEPIDGMNVMKVLLVFKEQRGYKTG